MRTHFCPEDGDWITFEGECSWCGMKENDAFLQMSDEDFRKMMSKLEESARPDITDD